MNDFVSGTLRNLGFNTAGAEDITVAATRAAYEAALSANGPSTVDVNVADPKRYAERASLIDYTFLVLEGTEFHVLSRTGTGKTVRLTVEANQRP